MLEPQRLIYLAGSVESSARQLLGSDFGSHGCEADCSFESHDLCRDPDLCDFHVELVVRFGLVLDP